MPLTRPFILLLLFYSVEILALPEAPPPHSISPVLNGLDIATYVKKDRIKITLYVINRESFPVLCDVQYRSGPDMQEAPEITVPAGKAEGFKFNYGRRGKEIVLHLLCIDPREKTVATPAESSSNPIIDTPSDDAL